MDIDSAGFNDLLQQAEQLTADMDGDGELPRVERNLRQIVDAGQQLWSRTVQAASKDSCDVKASILLGSKGFDLPKISQKLEALNTAKSFEPIEPIKETDIPGFLKNERENAMLTAIESSKKATFDRAERLFWESVESEWEQEKERILTFMSGTSHDLTEFSTEPESVLCETVNMKTRSAMDSIEMACAKIIYQYNEQIISVGTACNLAESFLRIFKEIEDRKAIELWEMVSAMVNIPLGPHEDVIAARCSLQMQTALTEQARTYLEDKYFQYIQSVVYGNLQHADLGPRPGAYFLVRSFLKIRWPTLPSGLEDGTVDGNPVWAIIYYCMRCGKLAAALDAAKSAGDRLAEFVPFLTEYKENEGRRLKPLSESGMRLQYRRQIKSSSDPFKRAVVGILGCDLSGDTSEVADKTDDYLWIKLCQLSPEAEGGGAAANRMTLSQLQTTLLEEYGETHFQAYQQPFLYFQVLFLTAQFEAAIEFLSRIEQLRCHAVHVAIVLYQMGLLALPQNHQAPLLSKVASDKRPMRRLNLARLIMMYTKKFEVTDPREALQYFYILRNLKGPQDVSLFMSCVSELVLETREFEMLLGKVEPDGCRKQGAIHKFEHDTDAIIEKVASDSEAKGQYEDAIKLYDLAGKHQKVIEILNKLLSQVVPSMNTLGSNRQRLESIALDIAERYKSQSHTAGTEAASTFYLLLDLMTFFNYAHGNQHVQALDTIKSLKLLPFSVEEVEQKVTAFSLYAEEVRRNFPDILLATMNILYLEYKKTKQKIGILQGKKPNGDSVTQDKYISYLRNEARALITFAGMIPYRMPGDTNAKLVQLEVMMN